MPQKIFVRYLLSEFYVSSELDLWHSFDRKNQNVFISGWQRKQFSAKMTNLLLEYRSPAPSVTSHRCLMQMNIWKFIYLNCEERYEDMIDYRSYTHNLSSCEIKAWKKIETWTGFELTKLVAVLRWLDSSVGRALHWYRRGLGFDTVLRSRYNMDFMWATAKNMLANVGENIPAYITSRHFKSLWIVLYYNQRKHQFELSVLSTAEIILRYQSTNL